MYDLVRNRPGPISDVVLTAGVNELLRWTPIEAWVMAEVAKRSLVAALDGAAPVTARDGRTSRFRVEVGGEAVELAIECEAEVAVLALTPRQVAGHRWRDGWRLALDHAGTTTTLRAGESVRLEGVRGRRVIGRLLHIRGEAPVPLVDVAFHKYTRQSSVVEGSGVVDDVFPFALPTLAQREPWWELDLGRTMTIASLRIDLAPPPAGTRVRAHAFGFQAPDGKPPAGSLVHEVAAEALARDGALAWFAIDQAVVARFVRIELVSPVPVALGIAGAEVHACELYAETLRASLLRAFVIHADRPLVLARAGDRYVPQLRYADVAARARDLAAGLAARLEVPGGPRVVLGLMLRNSAAWIEADLAVLDRGYLSVALAPEDGDERLGIVLGKAKPTCVICGPADVARVQRLAPAGLALVVACGGDVEGDGVISYRALLAEGQVASVLPPTVRAETDLYAVLFTSGSTGVPKGAMRTYATFLAMIASYAIGHSPRHLSFQPLSHLSERMYLPSLLVHGGCVAFSQGGAALFDELRAFEPSTLGSVPRLWEVLYAMFQRRVRDGVGEAAALVEARAAFGHRLLAISVGSAPVSAEVLAFMRRCFADVWVSEGYGSTEVGSIAYDGQVAEHVEVKLVPPPGSVPADGLVARGEIYVRTPHTIAGYLGDPEATAAAIDADGFFATGDLGERDATGRIRVIGRLRNTVKLAQGEFVSAERIETVLATASIVDRVFVHVVGGAAGVSALVMPYAEPLAALLGVAPGPLATLCAHPEAPAVVLAALAAHGQTHGLAAYEIPRGVLLDDAMTAAGGLVTNNGKLARGTIVATRGARLAALVSSALAPRLVAEGGGLVERVVRVASDVLRRPVGATEPLGLGVDSLAAAEILAALSDELGREVPLAWWFEARTPSELAQRLETSTGDVGAIAEAARADLALGMHVEPRAAQLAAGAPLLLTGATGFLGAHLVEALRARGHRLLCLVRAPDRVAANQRLAEALHARQIPVEVGVDVQAIPADLAAPDLGLAPADRAALDAIGAVVHAGATVSWLAPYAALRGPNVRGTVALLELAAGRPFHHVSTISTTHPGGDETSTLPFEHALAAGPYGLTKWIAEQHVKRAAAVAGVPVAIYRPAMIAGHTARGLGNADDFLCRYMAGCAELGRFIDRDDAIIDMTPVDFVAAAIAALVDGRPADGSLYHLANVDQSLTFAGLGRAMIAAGLPLAPASYDEFRTALHARPVSRLHALAAFLPPTFALGMGPWPCTRTLAALAPLGITRPRIDDAIIARYVAAL